MQGLNESVVSFQAWVAILHKFNSNVHVRYSLDSFKTWTISQRPLVHWPGSLDNKPHAAGNLLEVHALGMKILLRNMAHGRYISSSSERILRHHRAIQPRLN